MSDLVLAALITAIPTTLAVILAEIRVRRVEKKVDEVHTVIMKGHQKE